jgi:hypothetical protein
MNPLNQFTNDVNMRDEVKGFIDAFIDTEAVKRIYAREDVSGIADAKELIELAFNDLIQNYGIKDKTSKPISQAR